MPDLNDLDNLDALDSLDNMDALDDLDGLDQLEHLQANDASGYTQQPVQTGDLERDSEAEINEVLAGFKARARAEDDRFRLATDSEYWTCICFQSREQVEAFIKIMGIGNGTEKYLDGLRVAKKLGVLEQIPQANVPFNTSSRRDYKLESLVEEE